MPNKNTYQTNSLALASAISLFIPLLEISKDDNGHCIFSFSQTSELNKIIENYWNKNLSVDALEHFTQIKSLKARIYEML